MHQEIVLGEVGQVFEVEVEGLPREPVSVVVRDGHGGMQAAVTACTLDRVATVLAEDAPRGARVLHVGSTRGITPNTRYDIGGQRVHVYRLDGAHRVILRRPLLEPLREDTALRGCRILASIDDAWARAPANLTDHLDAGYQLAWTHAGGTAHTTADLVRTPLHARVPPEDVDGRYPGWRVAVGDPLLAITEAAELVNRDLRERQVRRARDAQAIRELVILRARMVAVEEAVMFRGEPGFALDAAEAPYLARLAALGIVAPPPPAPAPLPPRPALPPRIRRAPRRPVLGPYQELVHGDPDQAFEVETSVVPRGPVSVVVTGPDGDVQPIRCELDPVATALTEAAPPGARALVVASTTGIEPNTRYDLGGQRVSVYDVEGPQRVLLRRPLVEAAPAGTALRGCRILAPVDPGWIRWSAITEHLEVAAGYELVWTHADGMERTTADVVRARLDAGITPATIEAQEPGWTAAIEDPLLAIAEAAELVRRDLSRHPSLRRLRGGRALQELVIQRARMAAVEDAVMFRGTPYAALAAAEAAYLARLAVLATQRSPTPPPPPPVLVPVRPPSVRAALLAEERPFPELPVLEAIARWFDCLGRVSAADLRVLKHQLLTELATPDERRAAIEIIEAQRSLSRNARRLRTQLVAQLRAHDA